MRSVTEQKASLINKTQNENDEIILNLIVGMLVFENKVKKVEGT